MNNHIGKTVLVTVDNWFYAPNGRQYRAVFGTVHAVATAEDTLGIRPNGKSTNWYMKVGKVTLAGCQIHYVIECDEASREAYVRDWDRNPEKGLVEFDRPNAIYHAD